MTRNLSPTDLKRLHRSWRRQPVGRLGIILEDVQGPFNVGSIVRTAAAERVERMWMVGATPAPTHPKAQRTGLGCERFVDWSAEHSIDDALAAARATGMKVVGVELAHGAEPLFTLDLATSVCLVVGHEDRGLSAHCIDACDEIGYVPQMGRVGSLNVAQAAAIAIYEARRQVWSVHDRPDGGAGRDSADDLADTLTDDLDDDPDDD